MSKCDLEIILERPDRTYQPGDTVRGMVGVTVNADCTCNGLTLTREWRTHGSGNKARGDSASEVLFKGAWTAGEQHVHPFEFRLPQGPLTYHGHHLNVDWYLRASADIPWAFDPKHEEEIIVAGTPERLPRGALAKVGDAGDRTMSGVVQLGVGGVLVAVASGFAIAGVGLTATNGLFGMLFLALPVLFWLVGFGVFVSGVRKVVAGRIYGGVQVEVSPVEARGGDTVAVRVAFTPRRQVTLIRAVARLKAVERCVSGSGTNSRTHTRTVHESEVVLRGAGPLLPGVPVEIHGAVTLPKKVAPSFVASDNALQWTVEILLDGEGWKDWERVWNLWVSP